MGHITPKVSLPVGLRRLQHTLHHGPTLVFTPNGISIGSAVFAGLMVVTDRQTDTQTDHAMPACSNSWPHTELLRLNSVLNLATHKYL